MSVVMAYVDGWGRTRTIGVSLSFMDLCIAESVVLDGDVEWSWAWEYDTLTTGQIKPKDLSGNFAYPKRSEEQKRELKRLLDYLMEGITGLVGGEVGLPDDIRVSHYLRRQGVRQAGS